jgi:chemotaxis protein MotB
MVKGFLAVVLVVGVIVAGLWYFIHRPQAEALVVARADALRLQTDAGRCAAHERRLESEVADLQTVRSELQKASSELQLKVQEKETELAALRSTQEELAEGLKQELDSNQVQIQRFRDQLRVDLVDEVLFDSGQAEVKPAGHTVLQKVGGALKKTEGRQIEVLGHTDNVPILGALAKRYPTNWELSAARAVNVAHILQETGVDPQKLSAVAHGEFQPRASNDTDEGRHKNRRIEIVLGPKLAPEAQAKP